jgi:hypothetical protein
MAGATGAFAFATIQINQRKTLSPMDDVELYADDELRVLEVSCLAKSPLVYTVPFEKLEYLVYGALREGAPGTPEGGTGTPTKTQRRRAP